MNINIDQAKQDIINWMLSFVEQPHPALNGWAPCPYARKARVEGRFDIRAGTADPLVDCQMIEMGNFDVIAYVYNPADFAADRFDQLVSTLNQTCLLSRSMFALADHPDAAETVNGVVMNQGQWAICFLQDLDKLNSHASMLAEKGYYNDWPEDYLQLLFDNRQDPRTPK